MQEKEKRQQHKDKQARVNPTHDTDTWFSYSTFRNTYIPNKYSKRQSHEKGKDQKH